MRLAATSGLFLVLLLGPTLSSFGQGIVFYQPSSPIACYRNPNSSLPPVNFDVNGDGTTDLSINRADGYSVSVNPPGNNRIAGLPQGLLDTSSYLAPLAAGQMIDGNLSGVAEWYSLASPNMYSRAVMTYSLDGGYGGLFAGRLGYFGVEFQIDGQTHYGWVLLDCTTPFSSALGGGEIVSWAYEIAPNVGISAGMVPEPSTWALLALGTVSVVLLRRKQ